MSERIECPACDEAIETDVEYQRDEPDVGITGGIFIGHNIECPNCGHVMSSLERERIEERLAAEYVDSQQPDYERDEDDSR